MLLKSLKKNPVLEENRQSKTIDIIAASVTITVINVNTACIIMHFPSK